MKIIFTKNTSCLSKLIRWGLNEPVSHVAIVFDDKIVFHSNLPGVRVEWYNSFKRSNEIVFEKQYDMPLYEEEALYQQVIDENDKKTYDFSGFLYFIWRGALRKFLKKPFPSSNKKNNPNLDFCVELIGKLRQQLPALPSDEELAIMTPYGLYTRL